MPLLHQDNGRGGDGSNEMPSQPCQSIAEFLGLDSMLTEPDEALAVARNAGGEDWWTGPGSPEAAQTPRALVPSACFPPRHPSAFASFSESAQPGAAWNAFDDNVTDNRMHDIITSLADLKLPSASAGLSRHLSPPPSQLSYETSVELWSQKKCTIQLREGNRRNESLQRRASFCGVVQSEQSGGPWLRWSGQLPSRTEDPEGGFSPKLFLGGLPWEMTEAALMHALRHFSPVRVEWPGRESGGLPRGFAYVTLESERRVRALLAACRRDRSAWYYRLHSRKMRTKEVQVIPWAVCDSNWVCVRSARLEAARTVFVGALHGMLSAAALATIMNDLFSGVIYAGIDTDKNKYPIGSGRVTFNNVRSYVRAISAAFIEIHTDKFTKKVQVDPYLEDTMCSVCNVHQGPYFCRQPTCFSYFCRSCWSWQHSSDEHKPLMRNSKGLPGGVTLPSLITQNGHAPRVSPPHSDNSSLYNGHYMHTSDGTPSSSTSGASGTSGASDVEASTSEERAECSSPRTC